NGNAFMINVINLKESCDVDGTLIQEVKQGKDGCTVKLVSKEFALKWLDKHYSEATELQKAQLEQLRAQTDKLNKETDSGKAAEKVTIINDLPR
ncbi:terminase small subunit, partial [[Clostridium] innocuum]